MIDIRSDNLSIYKFINKNSIRIRESFRQGAQNFHGLLTEKEQVIIHKLEMAEFLKILIGANYNSQKDTLKLDKGKIFLSGSFNVMEQDSIIFKNDELGNILSNHSVPAYAELCYMLHPWGQAQTVTCNNVLTMFLCEAEEFDIQAELAAISLIRFNENKSWDEIAEFTDLNERLQNSFNQILSKHSLLHKLKKSGFVEWDNRDGFSIPHDYLDKLLNVTLVNTNDTVLNIFYKCKMELSGLNSDVILEDCENKAFIKDFCRFRKYELFSCITEFMNSTDEELNNSIKKYTEEVKEYCSVVRTKRVGKNESFTDKNSIAELNVF